MEKEKIIVLGVVLVIGLGFFLINDYFKKIKRKMLDNMMKKERISTYQKFKIVNNNKPIFSYLDRLKRNKFSKLDKFNRPRVAFAKIQRRKMPYEERVSISNVRPVGFENKKYKYIENRYVYNRCHLIGFQLTGENANKLNLITGTREFNTEGMLPFEEKVARYVRKTNKKVLYRVTPIYVRNNLIVKGVRMEAYSISDNGKAISFNVFVYNKQEKIKINYKTGNIKYSAKSTSKK